MPLPASGQIKIGDILDEAGLSVTLANTSLGDLAAGTVFTINTASASYPTGTNPDAISEWFSYNHSATSTTPSVYYWLGDGVNDTMRTTGTASVLASTSADFSWAGWYRIDETSAAVQQLGSLSKSTPDGNNQLFIQYGGTDNQLKFRYRHTGSFHQILVPLHSNNATTGTGAGSTNYWTASNRGNTNADGFVHIVFTYDASDRTASSGLQLFWNGTRISASQSTASVGSPTHWDIQSVAIGDLVSSSPYNANVWKGGIDNVSMHSKVLTGAEITALYNSGTPMTCADASVTSNLMGEYLLETDANNTTGTFPNLSNLNGGAFTAY